MGRNIKNERVNELARRAAELTGQTQTGVIEVALTRLLADLGQDPDAAAAQTRIDLVHRICADYRAAPGNDDRVIRRIDDLYDASSGLPR